MMIILAFVLGFFAGGALMAICRVSSLAERDHEIIFLKARVYELEKLTQQLSRNYPEPYTSESIPMQTEQRNTSCPD